MKKKIIKIFLGLLLTVFFSFSLYILNNYIIVKSWINSDSLCWDIDYYLEYSEYINSDVSVDGYKDVALEGMIRYEKNKILVRHLKNAIRSQIIDSFLEDELLEGIENRCGVEISLGN